jgi:hypothetical protein
MADRPRQRAEVKRKGWVSEPRLFWILQLAGWGCFGCFIFACYWSYLGASFESGSEFLRLGVAVAFSFGLHWICRWLWRTRSAPAVTIVLSIFSAAALATAANAFRAFVGHAIWGNPKGLPLKGILIDSVPYEIVFIAWCACYFAVKYFLQMEQQENQLQEAKLQQSQAEIATFRYQIPRRFFSDLVDGISQTVARSETSTATLMIAKVGDLLRVVLDEPDRQFAQVADEIDHVREYLDLQRTLVGRVIPFELDISPETESCHVPRWLLVPLLDEAVSQTSHLDDGTHCFRLSIKWTDRLLIEFEDRIKDFSFSQSLTNVVTFDSAKSLLQTVYGDQASFRLEVKEPFLLTMKFPIPDQWQVEVPLVVQPKSVDGSISMPMLR